ncbi:MAG: subtilisin family serine protease [Planctomycetota bacterium]|jgi:subtilisin family serine protease
MKTSQLRLFLSALLSIAAASGASAQEASLQEAARQRSNEILDTNPNLTHDPTTILVRFHEGEIAAQRTAILQSVGAVSLRGFTHVSGLELVGVGTDVDQVIARLAPFVAYAERNQVQRKYQVPNDTFYNLQWGMENTGQTTNNDPGTAGFDINAPQAWDVTTGDANFVIAVIDSGMQVTHEDLAANLYTNPGEIAGNGVDDDGNGYVDDVNGWNFNRNKNDPDDKDGHGTHTSGTVGAVGNNGIGVTGVNWNCKLMPLKFLGPNGGYTSDAIDAIEYCTTMNVKVSNNSWGGGGFSQALYDAIDASRAVGHVFVAAAGNDNSNNDNSPSYPGSYTVDNIISVAATTNDDGRASFSNYGANSVDIGAPGDQIASTYKGDGYVWNSGTSMASPHVAGVAALVYSENPSWTYGQVINRILSSARPSAAMSGITTTGGVLDAQAAVGNGGGGGGDTTPPGAPGGLSATAGDGSIDLDWADNGEADLAGYSVYRSTSSGGPYSAVTGSLLGASAYSDSGLSNGTTYYYVVSASDTTGNESGNSGEASGTPQGGGPATTMHVDSVVATTQSIGGGNKVMRVTITIRDDQGNPVSGASVTATASGDLNETMNASTDANGVAVLLSSAAKKGRLNYTACVDDVTHGSLTYAPGDNVTDCGSN